MTASSGALPWPVWIYFLGALTPILFNVGPVAMTGLRMVLIVMIVPLTLQLVMGRFGRLYWTDALFAAHVAWMIPVFWVNNPSQMIQQVGSTGIEFWGGYLVGRAYIRSAESFTAMCKALIIVVWILLPFALYESPTGHPIIIETIARLPGISSVSNMAIDGRLGLERVQAVFSHPIHYGFFCAAIFSLTFVGLKDVLSGPARYFHSMVIMFSTFLALSSAGILAIILQIGLITWITVFSKQKWRWKLLIGLMVIAYIAIDLLSNRTPVQVFMSYATFNPATAYWRSMIFEWGMKSVWTHPVFGIGLNDWVRPWFMFTSSVDNFWLLMAMRFGIPGFVLVVTGFALTVIGIMRRKFDGDPRLTLIQRAWVFNFLGISFVLCTVHVWTNIYSLTFFLFGAGIWLRSVEPTAPGQEPSEPREAAAATQRVARQQPRFTRFEPGVTPSPQHRSRTR